MSHHGKVRCAQAGLRLVDSCAITGQFITSGFHNRAEHACQPLLPLTRRVRHPPDGLPAIFHEVVPKGDDTSESKTLRVRFISLDPHVIYAMVVVVALQGDSTHGVIHTSSMDAASGSAGFHVQVLVSTGASKGGETQIGPGGRLRRGEQGFRGGECKALAAEYTIWLIDVSVAGFPTSDMVQGGLTDFEGLLAKVASVMAIRPVSCSSPDPEPVTQMHLRVSCADAWHASISDLTAELVEFGLVRNRSVVAPFLRGRPAV